MLWQISIVLLMSILNRVERLYFLFLDESVYSKKYEKNKKTFDEVKSIW